MKKILKRTLATVLTAVMLLTAVPVAGLANIDLFGTKAAAQSAKVGDIINFGSYPQSKVTDSATLSALNSSSKTWVSYGYYTGTGSWYDGKMTASDYMKYADVSYNGSKYRAVTFSQYRPYYTGYTSSASNTYQDDNGYYTGNTYYFKYEPLQWRVLDASEGLVMCTTAVDSQAYNNYILNSGSNYYGDSAKTHYASDYANSSIRAWLNNDFYNTAFTAVQQGKIKTTTCDNSSPYNSAYNSATTYDKVFLLSYNDVLNSSYGFSSSDSTYDTARRLKSTDYAKSQGCYANTDTSYLGNSWWWLRSAGNGSNDACGVSYSGYADDYDYYYYYDYYVYFTYLGVIPALKISNLTSEISESENESEKYYIQQHVDFINSSKYKTATDNRYATYLFENYHNSGIQTGFEFAYDIIEGVYESVTFSFFDGYEATTNPYDVILLDLISSAEKNYEKNGDLDLQIDSKLLKISNNVITLFQDQGDWNGSSILKELKEIFTQKDSGKDYSKNKLYKYLTANLNGKSKSIVNSCFGGVKYLNDVIDNINDSLSVVEYCLEMIQYVSVIDAYVNSTNQFKTTLKDVSDIMPGVNKTFGFKFQESANTFLSCVTDEAIIQTILAKAKKDGAITLANMWSDVCQDLSIKFISYVFKFSSDVSSKLSAAVWAYEKGFQIANWITGNDKQMGYRRLLRANYILDEAIYQVMSKYKSNLNGDKSYKNALQFDAGFSLFKNVQLYSIQVHMDYLKSVNTSFLNFILHRAGQLYPLISECASFDSAWRDIECHISDIGAPITDFYSNDVVAVACPTDVYVYDLSGNLVASIVNGTIESTDESIHLYVINDEKAICIPSIENYKIIAKASDDGEMTFACMQMNGDSDAKCISFDDIKINKDKKYEFVISGNNTDISNKSYLKTSDGAIVHLTADHAHIMGDWTIVKEATVTEEGRAERSCSECDYVDVKVIPKLACVTAVSVDDIKMNYKKSTTITPTITADEGAEYTVTWSSSNEKVATVDENGKVYAAKTGSAVITCTVTDTNGNTVTDDCTVTVKYSFGQWLIKILLFGWIWY